MKHETDIDATQLRCLVAAVRDRSITRAAERLAMGQPALSHVLARLRIRFGDPLLVRAGGAMAPTPRALELAAAAEYVLEGMERLHARRDVFDPARDDSRYVVTVTDYFEQLLAPALMSRLQSEAPGVSIEWRTPNATLARQWLESGEVDLRIAWVHAPWPGLRFARLTTDRLVCLAREGHPVVGRRLTLPQFLAAAHVRPAIAVSGGASGRFAATLTLEQYLGLHETARKPRARTGGRNDWSTLRHASIRVPMLAQSLVAIPRLVASTDLLATVPGLVLKSQLPLPAGLRVLAPPLELPSLQGALYWHERTHSEMRHRWFRRLVAAVAKEVAG